MSRSRKSNAVLCRASEHLGYEYHMFTQLAIYLAQGSLADPVLHNAALESFIIHTRNILDFLYPTSKVVGNDKYDDIIADDYFDDPSQWYQIRLEKSASLTQAHQRAHKEVAHLTYSRIGLTEAAKKWHFLAIAQEVSAMFDRFLESAPADRLGAIQRVAIEFGPT